MNAIMSIIVIAVTAIIAIAFIEIMKNGG